MKTICPNCVEKLVPNRKKLGGLTNWLICPTCGYRVRSASILFSNKQESEKFEHEVERINEGNHYKDPYNTEDYEYALYFEKLITI